MLKKGINKPKLSSSILFIRGIIHSYSTSGTYVYLTKNVSYSKQKKRSLPSRILIGKLNDGGLLIPNKNYVDIFGEEVTLDVVPDRADFVPTGLFSVLHSIADSMQLSCLLDDVFDKDKADMILDMASFMIQSEDNVMQYVDATAMTIICFLISVSKTAL